MQKQKRKWNIGYHVLGAVFILLLISWLLPTKADADTKVLTSIAASYIGNDVQKGNSLNTSDVKVIAYYSDNTWEVITTFTLSTSVVSQVGVNTITAYYGGMSATFTVVGVDQQVVVYYNVYFVSNGGSYVSPIINVKKDSTIVLPTAPTRYGYRFRGWYTTSSLVTPFSEDTPITETTYLYAKWEEKAVMNGDTISYTISNGTVSTTITANLAGQKYGANVDLDVSNIEASKIQNAVKKIASTNHYIAFEFNMEDYVYSHDTPIPITMTIPSTFNASKCAVYYTTNRDTIMGKMTGKLTTTSTYQFSAYDVGSYILIECEDQATTNTVDTSAAYITIEALDEPLTVNGEAALIVQFHNYPGAEKDVDLVWSSSDTDIADVNDEGTVWAYNKGTVTITVKSTDGKFKATKKIHVGTDPTIATSIKTNVSAKTLKKGSKFQLVTTVKPNTASSYVTYRSSNKAVATVTSGGKITARKKGSCYIYVKTQDGSNITKKIKITVK